MLFGGWTGSCAPGDKNAKESGSSVGLPDISHFMLQRIQNVIKKKGGGGHASYWNSEYMYSIACKHKVLVKSYSA